MSCKIKCKNEDWPCPCHLADQSRPMPGLEPKPRFRVKSHVRMYNRDMLAPSSWFDQATMHLWEGSLDHGEWIEFERAK